MASNDSIRDALGHWYTQFEAIPQQVHILCPKVDDDDEEIYRDLDHKDTSITRKEKEARIAQSHERIRITYWTSLLYGYDAKKAGDWLVRFGKRLHHFLEECDQCVVNWHMCRSKYLAQFSELWSEEAVEMVATLLTKIDFIRIDATLDWALEAIRAQQATGAELKKSVTGERYIRVLLTIFEALCCMPYLSVPAKRQKFQEVFEAVQPRKPLKLGSGVLLPAMTTFLFNDQPCRRPFAQKAWGQIKTDGLTQEQWDWAVGDHLAAAMRDVMQRQDASWDEIVRFWAGFKTILRTLSEDLVLHRLRAMEVKPSVYDMIFLHLPCQSEAVLVQVIDVFSCLLQKSPKAFWAAIGETRSAIIAEQVFAAPVYPLLLNQSAQFGRTESGEHQAIAWIGAFMRSLDVSRMPDACDAMLRLLLDTVPAGGRVTREGQAACTRAALGCFQAALTLFLTGTEFNTNTVSVSVNSVLNLAVKYAPRVIDCLRDGSGLAAHFGIQQAAVGVMDSMLQLDAKATVEEYKALSSEKKQQVQQAVFREPSKLWRAFSDVMLDGGGVRLDVVKPMLKAMLPLIMVDELRPPRKAPEGQKTPKLTPDQARFNSEFAATAVELGRVFDLLADTGRRDLARITSDEQLLRPIYVFPMHGNATINQAAMSLFKGITDETARAAAVSGMAKLHFRQSLGSFTYALNTILKPPFAWGPMQYVVAFSRDLITSLCDPSDGLLRLMTLEHDDVKAITRWWGAQWRAMDVTFDRTTDWSLQIDIGTMTTFCREAIELTEFLLAQAGVIASAFGASDAVEAEEPMTVMLTPCRKHMKAFCSMLRLRDSYLVDITVDVVAKIAMRLAEADLSVEAEARDYIVKVCVPGPDGKYFIPTNLRQTQKAELLRTCRIDAQKETELEIIAVRPVSRKPATAKQQSRLDAWAKSSASASSTSGASTPAAAAKDDIRELAGIGAAADKKKGSVLDAMRAQSMVKAKAKPKGPDASALAQQAAFREARARQKADAERKRAEMVAKLKNEALAKKSDMMVESSDEEEEDGDDDDDDDDDDESKQLRDFLNASAAGQKGQDAVDQRHRQNLLALKTTGPVRKEKQMRSAKDMRARLSPSMAKLHQEILEWDIFHDGADPPNGSACAKVADKYLDHASYRNTFYPLLVYEAWRSFVTDRDEATSKPFGIKVATRMNVDSFLEVTGLMPAVKYREAGIGEGDVLVLSTGEDPLHDRTAAHCLARIWRTVYKKDQTETTYRLCLRNNPLSAAIKPGFSMYAAKVTNMATIEREYAALESLQYCELRAEVMEAKPSPMLTFGEQRIEACVQNFSLNRGQAQAVLCATDNDAFTLIQGPPGTGKTKTIVAMVGALLTGVLGKPKAGVAVKPQLKTHQQETPQPQSSKKLLVCAPSNAAVDELVLRLKQGVRTMDGGFHRLNVLRLGRADAVNAANKDVTLDEIVRRKMEGDKTQDTARAERDKIHGEAGRVSREVREVRTQLDDARDKGNQMVVDALVRQLDALKRQQAEIGRRIDADKDSGNTVAREVELQRRRIQEQTLNDADMLCATLSGSGHDMFKNLNVEFETVIIDEAAQCVELGALIPLKYGALKCILVGDPKQLPPTVLSQSAARFGYDQSLFVRMQRNSPNAVHLLDRQYRMHPAISAFPSKQFYDGRLLDGSGDMAAIRRQGWHANPMLAPYRFFDVRGSQQKGSRGQSLVNMEEIKIAMLLYDRFSQEVGLAEAASNNNDDDDDDDVPSTPSTSSAPPPPPPPPRPKIGIITPYKAQLHELRARFSNRYGATITAEVEFNTTDAFQGRECDVIIFSCVRASPTGGIGFMTDIRRMNVGLTRAKSSLWILGDSRALVQGEFWNRLIVDARERGVYTDGDVGGMIRRSRRGSDVEMGEEVVVKQERQQHQQLPQRPQQQRLQQQRLQQQNPPSGSKRPLDGAEDGGGRPAKKAATAAIVPSTHHHKQQHQFKRKERPPPTDPSALAVLGLAPPERPPPGGQTLNTNMVSQIPQMGGMNATGSAPSLGGALPLPGVAPQRGSGGGPPPNRTTNPAKRKDASGGMFIARKGKR